MKEYCKKCGQVIKVSSFGNLFGEQKSVEFEEGHYCIKCAKIKIEQSRRA